MAILGHFAVALLALVHTPATAAIFDRDDRVPVDTRAQFSSVGIVFPFSRTHYSTGFLISSCYVLTVKHIVGNNDLAANRTLFFRIGHRSRGVLTVKGKVVADGKFLLKESFREVGQGRNRDWLVMKLDQCLGKKFGRLRLADSQPNIGVAVQSIGFPRDRPMSYPTLDPSCTIRARIGATVLHDCASRKGSSGAPILQRTTRNGVESLEVVAMHSAGVPDKGVRPFDYAYSSIAVPMSEIVPYIWKLLALDDSN